MVSKRKNRHIKLLFGVCIHAVALFVCCISIIKYRIKYSCHIIVSLVPALRWRYFFCWDMVVVTQFIQGHQSLCTSLCNRGEGLSCRSETDLRFLPPSKNLWRRGPVRVWTYHNYIKSREMHWGEPMGRASLISPISKPMYVCLQGIWWRLFDVCVGFDFSPWQEITNSPHFILTS